MPNPSNGLFNVLIKADALKNKSAVIEIFDAGGRLVQTLEASSTNTLVDMRSFAKGLYHLNVKSDSVVYRQKIAIQ